MSIDLSSSIPLTPTPSRRFKWPRAKYLLFAAIGAMYLYVLWTNESFLFNPKDPEWGHIAPFQWWLLPHGMARRLRPCSWDRCNSPTGCAANTSACIA